MSKDPCHDAIQRLYPYLDGELNAYRRARIRWHLRKCNPCDGAFSFEHRFKAVIREKTREAVPPEVVERLRAYLRSEEPGSFT